MQLLSTALVQQKLSSQNWYSHTWYNPKLKTVLPGREINVRASALRDLLGDILGQLDDTLDLRALVVLRLLKEVHLRTSR